jgi:lipopolysaccharide/colanic/teichoic acid biosynthesis glycosyltransferase
MPRVNEAGATILRADLGVLEERRRVHYQGVKLVIDVVVASALIVVLLPLLALIALAIAVDTRGPIVFTQSRVGCRKRRYGSEVRWEPVVFRLFKFRSMVAEADGAEHVAHVSALVANRNGNSTDTQPVAFKLEQDERITRVGKWLRRTSLDEVPQLVNVLRGQMSLVGPRPLPPYEVELHAERDAVRLTTRPGMTGLWQVRRRPTGSYDEMVGLDLEYVRRQSLWLDLKILILTIPAVLRGRGAS